MIISKSLINTFNIKIIISIAIIQQVTIKFISYSYICLNLLFKNPMPLDMEASAIMYQPFGTQITINLIL